MLPHSHSNVTAARYMSHTRPPHAHASMQDTHASTWSSLQGKLEERNTHRQRGHLPTGTEHRTGPSTTQSPIQICSTALFFFVFWQSRIQAYNADSGEKEATDNAAMKCRLKKWRIKAGEKKKNEKEKKIYQDERERCFISTLRSPSLTAPAQSFKTSSADGCR